MSANALIAITPGDPCGIGPEIVARSFLNDAVQQVSNPATQNCFVAGDFQLMAAAAQLVDPLGQIIRVQLIQNVAQSAS